MNASALLWACTLATPAIVVLYQALQWIPRRGTGATWSPAAHAHLRAGWFRAMSRQPGSEILAVQTLRNSLMSATLTASTSALGLMGTVSLAAPMLNLSLGLTDGQPQPFTPRLLLELVLMATLFAGLACSAMAVRYYNHAGFIGSLPVGSAERTEWAELGAVYVRRAGALYGWSLRLLMMVAPLVVGIAHPPSGPLASLVLVAVLVRFDRFGQT